MSSQDSRISDEEFERRLNAKSYNTTYRAPDEQNVQKDKYIDDWFKSQRQQSGQTLLNEIKEFEEQKQLQNFTQQQTGATQALPPNAINSQQSKFFNETKILFPKELKFENFLNDKYASFYYFSHHPKTSNKFEISDIDTSDRLLKSRNTGYLTTWLSISLVSYYMTKYLKHSNIPWGITYKFTFIGFLAKYLFFPSVMSSTIDKYLLAAPFEKRLDQIIQKYSLSSDPLFREVFESQQKK
ncbi:hypothetical protein TTHERM_00316040 (macronuclear) [Tetrahymena thermophila SB210]|uniref:Uncharacterized protein n=1 Tax=Tetrahymena thermophila (strain SB210) TaxID=312017 RepID=I7M975_TETTS|nr:hypothetical protein TTHERM_00316040 [Tetrahymena thermophila SB210]EAS01051.1 hypothetical protein TTHERM_00316040 [Tetrahymena thermophila SB210]|eukprot:XP_001021296.1 hypothetical protein TTHERM_00316040 [Tetrahymena thermophila SB210]